MGEDIVPDVFILEKRIITVVIGLAFVLDLLIAQITKKKICVVSKRGMIMKKSAAIKQVFKIKVKSEKSMHPRM